MTRIDLLNHWADAERQLTSREKMIRIIEADFPDEYEFLMDHGAVLNSDITQGAYASLLGGPPTRWHYRQTLFTELSDELAVEFKLRFD